MTSITQCNSWEGQSKKHQECDTEKIGGVLPGREHTADAVLSAGEPRTALDARYISAG